MEYFSRLQKCWPEDGQAPASLPIAGERWKSYPIRSTGSHLFNESNSTFNASGAPTYVGPMPDEKQPKELFAKYFRRQPNTFLDIKVSSLTAKYFWVLSWQHRDVLSFEQVLASSNENYIFCFKPLTRYPSLPMYKYSWSLREWTLALLTTNTHRVMQGSIIRPGFGRGGSKRAARASLRMPSTWASLRSPWLGLTGNGRLATPFADVTPDDGVDLLRHYLDLRRPSKAFPCWYHIVSAASNMGHF